MWKSKLRKGACYVNDRNYSHDYRLIKDVQKAQASFVLRLHNNAVFTPLESARALSEADRQVGVAQDIKVRLGSDPDGPEGHWCAWKPTVIPFSCLLTSMTWDQMRPGLSALDG